MDINQILVILMFATFIGILLIGYPIPFALGGTAVL
jgi:TRAP-type mannitol/chloroaromatic compound transport system permease large subunit